MPPGRRQRIPGRPSSDGRSSSFRTAVSTPYRRGDGPSKCLLASTVEAWASSTGVGNSLRTP